MIRKNGINCKLILERRTGKELFGQCTDSFRPEMESCPCCGAAHSCSIFAYYNRQLIDIRDRNVVEDSLCVPRLLCSQCESTHAVLPDPIIPYGRHSLFFILHVLAARNLHCCPVEKLCETYGISERTLYRWQKLFEEHRLEWQGRLRFEEKSLREAILTLVRREPFSAFAEAFFRKTGITFLQSHKNPAPFRRASKSGAGDFP